MEKRRSFKPEEKVKIVLEVLREEKTLNEIAAEYEVHPNQLSRWKAEFLSNAARTFSKETDNVEKVKQSYEKEKDELLRQIGQLSYEVTWLKKNLACSKSREDRMNMIERGNKRISISKQAKLLCLNRINLYYKPVPIKDEELRIKRIIDEIFTKHHQVWSIDITYCRMQHGFMYMTAIIDWYSHYIVGFSLSNTLEKASIVETIKKAIMVHGAPEIMNSDQ